MAVVAGEAGHSPTAYSLILDSFRPSHVGYAMSIYKLGVKVGAGLALVIGVVLYDYWATIGIVTLPIFGDIKPWQMTLISVGAPGVLLSALLLTIAEPKRRDLATSGEKSIPIKTVFRFMWSRNQVYISPFNGASMLAMQG